VNTFAGKNTIGFFLMGVEGKRISKISSDAMVGKSALVNLNVVTSEVEFTSKYSYPYTFTLMCGSKKAGPEGEGEFDVTVWA
jgi:hypothetical protein